MEIFNGEHCINSLIPLTGNITATAKINGDIVLSESFPAFVGIPADFIGNYDVILRKGESVIIEYEQSFTLTSGTRFYPPSTNFEVENLIFKGTGCNCPDKTKQVAANPQSPYPSEQVTRGWTASAAGTPDKCWHEWAVEILTNPNIDLPQLR